MLAQFNVGDGRRFPSQSRERHDGLGPFPIPERTADRGGLEGRRPGHEDDVPKGTRHEILPLPLAVRDDPQRGSLHSTGGEDLAIRGTFDRQESSEDRAPGEVDALPRGGGLRKGPIWFGEVLEGSANLGWRHRAESGPLRGQFRPPAPKGLQCLHADEFPFPIVVRREDHFVRRVGKEPQHVMQRRGRLVADRFQVDQIIQVSRFPILDVRRVVDLHDMPAEREKGVLVPLS